MEDNPFNLTVKHGGNSPKRPRYANIWSSTEQNEKLQGYLEISQELWPSIKPGIHIRYINIDGEFKSGGFVVKNPYIYNASDDTLKPTILESKIKKEKIGIKLQSSFNRQSAEYAVWIVAYEDISKIYVKIDASIRTVVNSLENTIENININMKKITEYVKHMDNRLKKLEAKK